MDWKEELKARIKICAQAVWCGIKKVDSLFSRVS